MTAGEMFIMFNVTMVLANQYKQANVHGLAAAMLVMAGAWLLLAIFKSI